MPRRFSRLRVGADRPRLRSSDARSRLESCWPKARRALRSSRRHGFRRGRFAYYRSLRKAAAKVIGEERAKHLSLRDLRHGALTDLAEATENLAAVAAVAGHRDLQTTSRYFNARTRAANAALRARTEADRRLESLTESVTLPDSQNGGSTLPRFLGDGRVAQLDRALPSGGRSRRFESCRVRPKSVRNSRFRFKARCAATVRCYQNEDVPEPWQREGSTKKPGQQG